MNNVTISERKNPQENDKQGSHELGDACESPLRKRDEGVKTDTLARPERMKAHNIACRVDMIGG